LGSALVTEIQDYIHHPNENLHAEYKRWLDLSEHENRANLARHIAALANHGGGFIIFGFDDATLLPTEANPYDISHYSHDGIAAITRKYLDPVPHCDVREVVNGKHQHSYIIVPSHGATPICAKADGPVVNGKVKGIKAGSYYIRKAGPESAPIVSSMDWVEVIRRCVTHDRAALLGALGAALASPKQSANTEDRLLRWHDASYAAYKQYVLDHGQPDQLYARSVHLSYLIETADREALPKQTLKSILREVNAEMRDRVNTGWSLFFPFDRMPIDPYFISDSATGDTDQFLEENLLREYVGGPNGDFWRVADDGRATTIRPIRSDFLDLNGWQHGKFFSPNNAARELGELVRHAEGLSSRFREPQTVSFRCEWRGLEGRMIADPNSDWSPGRVARSASVASSGQWPVTALSSRWPEIVSELLAPLMRVFDPNLSLSAEWVQHAASGWRPIGNHYP
jgi:Putative DNA-binding domain